MTQPEPPTKIERIGAWCLAVFIVVGFVAFVIAAIAEAIHS